MAVTIGGGHDNEVFERQPSWVDHLLLNIAAIIASRNDEEHFAMSACGHEKGLPGLAIPTDQRDV